MRKYTLTGFADEIDNEFDVQLDFLNKLGVKYMEIRGVDGKNIADYDNDGVVKIKEKLDKANIKISAIGSPIGKYPIEDDFAPHFETYKQICETAKILDTRYIRMFSFFVPKGANKADYKDEVHARLAKMIEYAKEQDLVLLHENEKDIYGDTSESCLELMENFYCDNFKAIFDFANFVQCEQDTKEAYDKLKSYIHYVHIKDSKGQEVVPFGMGDGNAKEILGDILFTDYQGFLSLEPHLTNFTGLADLEAPDSKEKMMSDGKFAWWLALNALKSVLYDLEA